MIDWIIKWDRAILLAIHRNQNLKKLDPIFAAITKLGGGAFTFPLTIICFLVSIQLGLLLFISLTCCFLTVQFLKWRWLRWRPYYGLAEVQWYRKKDEESSFPSGHSAAAFATAVCFYHYFHIPYLFFGLAGLIGFSRVQLGDHYPSDVISGAILGLFFSQLTVFFM